MLLPRGVWSYVWLPVCCSASPYCRLPREGRGQRVELGPEAPPLLARLVLALGKDEREVLFVKARLCSKGALSNQCAVLLCEGRYAV